MFLFRESIQDRLIAAGEKGDLSSIRKLLQKSRASDVNFFLKGDDTFLSTACRDYHLNIVKLLVSHPDIDINLANEMSGETALHIACRRSSVEVVKVLLAGRRIQVNVQDKSGQTGLIIAVKRGRAEIVEALLACSKIDVNIQENSGHSALMIAASGCYGVSWASWIAITGLLLSNTTIDVNLQVHESGKTAIMLACEGGCIEIVQMLLASRKINSDIKNVAGYTALNMPCIKKEIQSLLRSYATGAPLANFTLPVKIEPARIQEHQEENANGKFPSVETPSRTAKEFSSANTSRSRVLITASSPSDYISSIDRTAEDRAALDAFLQSYKTNALLSSTSLDEMLSKVSAHDRALHVLVCKQKECPSLFWFYPKEKSLRNWLSDPMKCLFQNSLMMVVVCPISLHVVKCGPDGVGWEINAPKVWVKTWGPAILYSVYVFQAAVIAGRVVGIPLPQPPSAAGVRNALGLRTDAVSKGLEEVLRQKELQLNCFDAFTQTTMSVCAQTCEPLERLTTKILHRQALGDRDSADNVDNISLREDLPTKLIEEAYKSIHTFLTTGENAMLGKLEDQLRESMERVMAEDGDVEWVSIEAIELWKQKHGLIKESEASVFHTPASFEAIKSTPSSPISPTIVSLSNTPSPPGLASSWLAVRLRQKGVREDLIWECEQKLVLDEDLSEERLLASLTSDQFNASYLTSVGIRALGLQQKLLVLYQELSAQYACTPAGSDGSSLTFEYASAEITAALATQLDSLRKELTQLKATSSSNRSSAAGFASGGSSSSGTRLQQVLKQQVESVAASINPRTGLLYTIDELVLEIQLMKSDIGTLATNMEVIKDHL